MLIDKMHVISQMKNTVFIFNSLTFSVFVILEAMNNIKYPDNKLKIYINKIDNIS